MRLNLIVLLVASVASVATVAAYAAAPTANQPRPSSTLPGQRPGLSTAPTATVGARLRVGPIAYMPAPPTAGASLSFDFRIENTGNAASSGGWLFFIDCRNLDASGPACPFSKHSRAAPNAIPAGSSRSLILATNPWSAGNYQVSSWMQPPRGWAPQRQQTRYLNLVINEGEQQLEIPGGLPNWGQY